MRQRLYNLISFVVDLIAPPPVVYVERPCSIQYYRSPQAQKGNKQAA